MTEHIVSESIDRSNGDEERLRQELKLVRLLQAVAVAANEAHEVEEALQACLDEVCVRTGWQIGHALLMEGGGGGLHSTGIWHLADSDHADDLRQRSGSFLAEQNLGSIGHAVRSGTPVWITSIQDGPHLSSHNLRSNVKTGMIVPIGVASEVVGVLEFYSTSVIPTDESLLEVMAQIGVQVGRVVERARTEEALKLSEAKFAGIISISSDAVVSVDEEQRISTFNQGAEQIFGYAAEEVLGKRLDLLIPERYRESHEAAVSAFGDGAETARRMGERGRITGLRKNGEIFPADASISKLQVGGKRIYTAVLRDVTERVRSEQELARSNAELEQFAYVASHDLQEPLRMVASYTQLLERRYGDQLDDDAREFIGFAVDGVKRMQALINDLLAFSRVGTRGGEPDAVDSEEVLERVLMNLGAAIEEGGATVTNDPLPTVVISRGELEQVFQNLIGNALKFRKPGTPPSVHVSGRRGRREWIFSVADNGIGIAPEYAERIFVLFQRLHSRAEYPGTGIGLSICKKIVERYGGRIWFDSAPDQGTTFHFSIPDQPGRAT